MATQLMFSFRESKTDAIMMLANRSVYTIRQFYMSSWARPYHHHHNISNSTFWLKPVLSGFWLLGVLIMLRLDYAPLVYGIYAFLVVTAYGLYLDHLGREIAADDSELVDGDGAT